MSNKDVQTSPSLKIFDEQFLSNQQKTRAIFLTKKFRFLKWGKCGRKVWRLENRLPILFKLRLCPSCYFILTLKYPQITWNDCDKPYQFHQQETRWILYLIHTNSHNFQFPLEAMLCLYGSYFSAVALIEADVVVSNWSQ